MESVGLLGQFEERGILVEVSSRDPLIVCYRWKNTRAIC